VIDAE
jgi:hypothetical protein